MKKAMNDYQIFVAKLYAACDIAEGNVVLVDTNQISDILEMEFYKVGLIDAESEE